MAGRRSPPSPSISQLTSPPDQITSRRWRFRRANSHHIPGGTGSRIALFTRQALDEGRQAEAIEYGDFKWELETIGISSERLDDVIEKATAAFYRFSAKMQASGHDIRPGDLVVDLAEVSKFRTDPRSDFDPIYRARGELLGAIVAEVKKRICE